MKKNILIPIGLIVLLSRFSSFAYYENYGSKSDLWDTSQGTIVTAHSSYRPGGYDSRDVFGGAFGSGIGLETGGVIFTDGQQAGYVHSIEWRTTAPVTLGSFSFYASEDLSPLQRAVARFRLLAKSANSATYDLTLYDYTPQQPYNWVDQSQYLLLTANISAVTAQDFRAEFFDLGGSFNGPRIVELDGFAPVPEPTSLILFAAGMLVIARNRKWVANK